MTIVASGTEILVSTTDARMIQASAQITTLADGGFAVTWRRHRTAAGRFVAGCTRLTARQSTAVISWSPRTSPTISLPRKPKGEK
jgi:hypothetical protein